MIRNLIAMFASWRCSNGMHERCGAASSMCDCWCHR